MGRTVDDVALLLRVLAAPDGRDPMHKPLTLPAEILPPDRPLRVAWSPDLGLPVELALFAVLTLVTSIGSRKLIRRVNPAEPDINDRANRLLGQRAQVVQPFVDGRGRVFVSGSEWPADIDGDAPPVGSSVVVEGFDGPRLKVRT